MRSQDIIALEPLLPRRWRRRIRDAVAVAFLGLALVNADAAFTVAEAAADWLMAPTRERVEQQLLDLTTSTSAVPDPTTTGPG